MPPIDTPYGFWSYVHADNDAESNRILKLSELIKAEYEMITGGNKIELFVDRNNVAWGNRWRSVIEDALTETAFFIPIVTERYVQSVECRKEILKFAANAKRRGVPELVLPILYLDVRGLKEDSPDEVKATIAQTQYEKWNDLRFEEESSPKYRRAVNKLAVRLSQIAEEVSMRPETIPPEEDSGDGEIPDDDALGMIDALANTEVEFPEWTDTINRFQQLIHEIGELFTRYAPVIEKAATPSAKVVTAKRLAKDLNPLADEFVETGNKYLDQARSMDGNISIILAQIAKSGVQDGDQEAFDEFQRGLREIAEGAGSAIQSVTELQTSANDVGQMSKDIRKPLRKVATGAQSFLDGQTFFDGWIRRLDELDESNDSREPYDES